MRTSKGFTLIEVAVALALLVAMQGMFYPNLIYLQQHFRCYRLHLLCDMVTNELTSMQLRALQVNGNSRVYKMVLKTDGDGYDLLQGTALCKQVRFSRLGWGDFAMTGVTSFQFLAGGAPQAYTCLRIKAKDNAQMEKIIEIQPITGRIVVKHEEN